MARHTAYVGQLIIANGATASNSLVVPQGKMTIALIFVSPAAYTGTITVQGALATGTPQALAIDATALTLTAAQTKRINISGIETVKLASGSAEGAQRVVDVYAEFDQ